MKCVGHILKAYDVLGYNLSFPLVKSFLLSDFALSCPGIRETKNFVKTILETHLENLANVLF